MEVVDKVNGATPSPETQYADTTDEFPSGVPQQTTEANQTKSSGPEKIEWGADVPGDGIQRSKRLTEQLAGTLEDLWRTIDASETERKQLLEERAQMIERIHQLEEDSTAKEKFQEMVLQGVGGSLTDDDLKSMQSVTDTLTADPDRLTVLFNIVQQAGKFATIVSVYTQLREFAQDA